MIFESSSVGGKQAQGKMDNASEFYRKSLSNRKKDFDGEGFE
jgi:hypothetical protein